MIIPHLKNSNIDNREETPKGISSKIPCCSKGRCIAKKTEKTNEANILFICFEKEKKQNT